MHDAEEDVNRYGMSDPRGARGFYSFASVDGAFLDAHLRSRTELSQRRRPSPSIDHAHCRPDPCLDLRLQQDQIEDGLVDLCRRRIEVHHRLAHRYGPDGRRRGPDECSPDTYVVAAVTFAEQVRSADSNLEMIRWLNALLKALDIAQFLAEALSPSVDYALKHAIRVERSALDRIVRQIAQAS